MRNINNFRTNHPHNNTNWIRIDSKFYLRGGFHGNGRKSVEHLWMGTSGFRAVAASKTTNYIKWNFYIDKKGSNIRVRSENPKLTQEKYSFTPQDLAGNGHSLLSGYHITLRSYRICEKPIFTLEKYCFTLQLLNRFNCNLEWRYWKNPGFQGDLWKVEIHASEAAGASSV